MADQSAIGWTDATWTVVTGGRTPKAGGREIDGRTWDEFPTVVGAWP